MNPEAGPSDRHDNMSFKLSPDNIRFISGALTDEEAGRLEALLEGISDAERLAFFNAAISGEPLPPRIKDIVGEEDEMLRKRCMTVVRGRR